MIANNDDRVPSAINRRDFAGRAALLMAGGVAISCAPGSVPPVPAPPASTAPAQAPAWQQEWDKLVSAAKSDGKLALVTVLGTGYRKSVEEFQATFPGIQVDHTQMMISQFGPKIRQEYQAGVRNFDVITTNHGPTITALRQEKVFQPVRPALFRPDVLDEKAWRDGFDAGWKDQGKMFAYAAMKVKNPMVWINTEMVAPGEIKTGLDLLNPKWKGKMIGGDPRSVGGGFMTTALRQAYGDDIVNRLWKDQDIVLGRNGDEMTRQLIQGKFAVGVNIGVPASTLRDYQAQGLGKNIVVIDPENTGVVIGGSDTLCFFDQAPHPNAAKLFINWFLTKAAQALWSKNAITNSRRADVDPVDPELFPVPGKTYLNADTEEAVPLHKVTFELANKALN